MEALLGRAAARIWRERTFQQQRRLQQEEQEQALASASRQATAAAASAAPAAAAQPAQAQQASAKARWLSRPRATADDILAKPSRPAFLLHQQPQAQLAPAEAGADGSGQGAAAPGSRAVRTTSNVAAFSAPQLPPIGEDANGACLSPGAREGTEAAAAGGGSLPLRALPAPAGPASEEAEVAKAVLAELGQRDPANVSWQLLAEISRRAELGELLAEVKRAALGRGRHARRLGSRQCRSITRALNRRLLGGASRPGLDGAATSGGAARAAHRGGLPQERSQAGQQQEGQGAHGQQQGRRRRASLAASGAGTADDEEDETRTELCSSEWRSSVGNLSDLHETGSLASITTAGSLGGGGGGAASLAGSGEEWAEGEAEAAQGGGRRAGLARPGAMVCGPAMLHIARRKRAGTLL
jgi:hypothetical protein